MRPSSSVRAQSAARLALLGAGSLVAACGVGGSKDYQDGGVGVIVVEVEPEPPELVLAIEDPNPQAGDSVGWALTLVYDDGDTEVIDGTLRSDREAPHFDPDGAFVPHLAGAHQLTGSAVVDGEVWTAAASVDVLPGPVHAVDLALADLAFAAGESVLWSVSAEDAFGNRVDSSGTEPDVAGAPLTIGPSSISGTLPGAYTVTATVESVMDTEVVVVTPAAPAGVTLSLSDTELERFETTSASIAVVDAFGNPTADSWTLSVLGDAVSTDDYSLSYNNITFYSEGVYTVRVDVDGTALFDEVGPLLIDSTGPVVTLDTPERGGWNDGLTGEVAGTVEDDWSGVTSLFIDGTEVTPAADGSFSQTVEWAAGINVVETEATDGDGNRSTDTRAVLAGDFLPAGDPVSEGMSVRIHEGSGGFDTLETLGEELVDDIDLDSLIPSPVLSEREQTCISIWPFGTSCFTWYALTLYVDNPSFGDIDLDLDPFLPGRLRGTLSVDDIYLRWRANATVAEIDFSGSGDITADSIDVSMDFYPSVSGGVIDLGLGGVTANTRNFYFDWDSWLYDALDFFGLDTSISGLLSGFIEGALEDVVEDQVPDLIGDALQDLEIAFGVPLEGNTYTIEAVPEDIEVDTVGLTLLLETYVTPDSWVKSGTDLGSLAGDYGSPTYTGSPGTVLGVHLDFLNQFLHAAWGGGLLDMELESSALGLDVADLEFLLPGLTELTITTDALLPPVVVPDGTAADLELQLGDLLLTLYNGDATTGDVMIQVYVSAYVEMDVDAAADGSALEPELGDMDLYFDVVVPESNTLGASDTEALLELLVPLLLPTLTDALTEIPIPDIEGFTLSGVTVDLAGPDDGVLTLGGDLTTR